MKKILLLCSSLMIGSALCAAPLKKIVVGPDDTVYGIAYAQGILTRSLISANNLQAPYALVPGQVLIVPAPNDHIVGAGETLKTIAEMHGVNVDVLAQENSLLSSYTVKPGDVLFIPPRDTESFAAALAPASSEITMTSLAPLPLVKVKQETPPAQASASAQAPAPGLPTELAEELARERGEGASSKPMLVGNLAKKNEGAPIGGNLILEEEKQKKPEKKIAKKQEDKKPEEKKSAFIWPVSGTVSKKFEPGTHDGINIQVAEGTPVKAAMPGEVMYVGDEIKNLGNLILLKHKNGYVTAYAYLSESLVKKGEAVKQGAVIAKSGKTGGTSVPQLHFEVREGKKPIDPLSKLKE